MTKVVTKMTTAMIALGLVIQTAWGMDTVKQTETEQAEFNKMQNKFLKNESELREKALNAKAIIFDVDGVLMNSVDDSGRYLWSKNAKEDLGLGGIQFKRIFSDNWMNVTRGYADTREHLDQAFLELNLDITADIFLNYWLSRDNHVDLNVLDFVKSISPLDIPLYIGTNQDKFRTAHIQDIFASHFKAIFSSAHIGFVKPEEGFYKHIELSLSLSPSDILLIDDTLENIEGAKKRGWKTYYYV